MHKKSSKREQLDSGWDGLAVLGFHHAMVVRLTGDLPSLGGPLCDAYRLGVARPFLMLKALFLTLP